MCSTKRLQLRAWLKLKIDSGRVPGLRWLDREEQIFRVPWKHASRANWKEETDASLFRDWAEYTEKYRRGIDQPEPKRWKTNFRCALNALPDIVELAEKSCTFAQDPHKVFQMKKRSEKVKSKRKRKSVVDTAENFVSSCFLSRKLFGVFILPCNNCLCLSVCLSVRLSVCACTCVCVMVSYICIHVIWYK